MTTKQEILDYFDNVLHPIVSPDNWNVYSELHDMIEDLPLAEPQWIPVSEKLPKYSDSVLISACGYEIDIGSYYCDKWHINGCGPVEDGIVIAWMPLPKPYKGDKNDYRR